MLFLNSSQVHVIEADLEHFGDPSYRSAPTRTSFSTSHFINNMKALYSKNIQAGLCKRNQMIRHVKAQSRSSCHFQHLLSLLKQKFFRLLAYWSPWGGLKPMFRNYISVQFSRSTLQEAWPLKMGQIGSTETSISKHPTPLNNPKDRRNQFNRGGSLRSQV